jgi:hypothetical protein
MQGFSKKNIKRPLFFPVQRQTSIPLQINSFRVSHYTGNKSY